MPWGQGLPESDESAFNSRFETRPRDAKNRQLSNGFAPPTEEGQIAVALRVREPIARPKA
jgi:hypothetical protein